MQQISSYDGLAAFWEQLDVHDAGAVVPRSGAPPLPPRSAPAALGWRARKRAVIIAMLEECSARGMTRTQAAAHLGVSYGTVGTYCQEIGGLFKHGNAYHHDPDRTARMAAMYASGATLAEIAHEWSISRERVRQLINKYCGMTGADGGARVGAVRNAEKRAAEDDARFLARHGCTRTQWRQIPRDIYMAYVFKKRNVVSYYGPGSWGMTLWDYHCAWEASGHRPGGGAEGYGMTRVDPAHPFAPGNVEIVKNGVAASRATSHWHAGERQRKYLLRRDNT